MTRMPPSTPDLNPIEKVWASLKIYVEKQQPQSIEEMKLCVQSYCNEYLSIEQCNKYIDNLKKVIY